MISIIAAIATNNAIGLDNDLLWRLPNDMKRFRELTTGHIVVMGRKTFESLPKGALPNRVNIVITGNTSAKYDNCTLFDKLETALDKYKDVGEIFIIGGASIYKQAMAAWADKLYITAVDHSFKEADVFFPDIDPETWILTTCETFPADEKHLYSYTFQTYTRRK